MEEADRLLEALLLLGVDPERAQRAIAAERVPLALVEQLRAGQGDLALEEVAARAGAPVELLRERERIFGLPPGQPYTEGDVADARFLAGMLDLVPADALVQVLRGDAQALSRVALNHLQLLRDHVVVPTRREGGDDITVALVLAEAFSSLLPSAERVIGASYRRVLLALLSSELVVAGTRDVADVQHVAVGFADVVGYTSLSARVDPAGLHEVLAAFETRCYTVAALHGLQLVKFLGDAAMFVSADPRHLARGLLELVEPVEEDSPLDGNPIKAGMAAGPVLTRAGDYFGSPVNLAARLTDRARGARVLADEDLADVLRGEFRVHRLQPMRLRGVGQRRPLAVRPPDL